MDRWPCPSNVACDYLFELDSTGSVSPFLDTLADIIPLGPWKPLTSWYVGLSRVKPLDWSVHHPPVQHINIISWPSVCLSHLFVHLILTTFFLHSPGTCACPRRTSSIYTPTQHWRRTQHCNSSFLLPFGGSDYLTCICSIKLTHQWKDIQAFNIKEGFYETHVFLWGFIQFPSTRW